jgi:hypothetical protein
MSNKVKTEIERNHQATMSLELEHYASAGAIRKIFSECIKAENKLRKQLKDDGFLDPMENEDLSRTLIYSGQDGSGDDVPTRRFMEEFKRQEENVLAFNQVRDEEYDEEDCILNLVPEIKEFGGLKYPIFVNYARQVVHGHDRLFAWRWILANEPEALMPEEPLAGADPEEWMKVPTIVISESVLITEENEIGPEFAAGVQEFNDIWSAIICNPDPDHRPYNMKSIAVQVRKLFKADRFMGGLNPSGKNFYDPDDDRNEEQIAAFDVIMDKLHRRWRDPGVRTKIRKLTNTVEGVKKGKMTAKEMSDKMVKKYKCPNGATQSGKQFIPMKEWNKNGTYYTVLGTAGDKIESQIGKMIFSKFLNGTAKSVKRMKIGGYISPADLKGDVDTNDEIRRKFVCDIAAYNILLAANGFAVVEKCFFEPQLNNPRDKGMAVTWDAKAQRFIDDSTKKAVVAPAKS